jgi:hypothetical protein
VMLSSSINDIVIASNGDIYGSSATGSVVYMVNYTQHKF